MLSLVVQIAQASQQPQMNPYEAPSHATELHTKVDAQCDKLATFVRGTS